MTQDVPATVPVTTSSPATVETAPTEQSQAPLAVAGDPTGAALVTPPPATLTPERYELALEDYAIDPTLVQQADPILRDVGLSNDAANKLLPVARDIMARTQESVVRQIEGAAAAQKQAWHQAFVSDPEIGGTRRTETEHFAAKGLDALGYAQGHPFRQALDNSGFGNHPDMIRAFRRLGELVGEDGTFVRPTTATSRNRPVWERLYPNESR